MKKNKILSIVIVSILILLIVLVFALGYLTELRDNSLNKARDIFNDNKMDFLSCGEDIKEYLFNADNSTLSITEQNYMEYFAPHMNPPLSELLSEYVQQVFATKEKDTFEIVFVFKSKAKNIEWGIIYSNAEVKTGQPIRKLTEYWYAYRIAYT